MLYPFGFIAVKKELNHVSLGLKAQVMRMPRFISLVDYVNTRDYPDDSPSVNGTYDYLSFNLLFTAGFRLMGK